MRTQRTGVIGAIVRDINDPFLSLLVRELQKVAHQQGIELFLGHAGYDPHIAGKQLSVMRDWFDSLLIIGDMLGHQAAISRVGETDNLSKGLDGVAEDSVPLVSIDDAYGTRLGMEYLYSLGHRRIAFIGNTEYEGIRARQGAFQHFVESEGLYWEEDYYQPCPNNRAAAAEAAKRLVTLSSPPQQFSVWRILSR